MEAIVLSAPRRSWPTTTLAWTLIWALMLPAVFTAAVSCGRCLAEDAPADAVPPDFEPAEISIGEPLQLPFQQDATTTTPVPTPKQPALPQQSAPQAPPARQPSPAFVPTVPGDKPPTPVTGGDLAAGTGWLGLSVDDSLVTGRLVVVDVAPQGPAALAGVAPNDTLLALNGTPLRNADEMAAALAAISPGMDVKMAVGRGDRIDEVVAKAAARPREAATREWQAATEPRAAAPAAAPPTPRVAMPAPVATPAPAPAAAPRFAAEPQPLPAPVGSVLESPAPAPAKGRAALGVRTVPVDPAVQARFHLPEQSGAFVIGVVQDLPASKAGVPPGSVIVAIDNRPVRDPGELSRLVSQGPVGAPMPIQYVLPGGEARRAEVTLQSLETPLERALTGEPQPAGPTPASVAPPSLSTPERRNRVVQSGAMMPAERTALEEEVRRLRDRVESLERSVERLTPRRR